ncbi:MAG: iron ABC transporter permease [Lachnospiraceae bacterium]|nr:iron ABC transporter permease [Lachnospiraceae bacterium]
MTGESRNRIRYTIVFVGLLVLFCVSIIWNINTGSVSIPLKDILSIIFRGDATDATAYGIIWKIRLPRLMLAAVLGGALSLSGFLLQTFFRNPIAGPFVLGISSGAKMFLAVVTIGLSSAFTYIPVIFTVIAAFLGSMLSMFIVLAFSGKIKNMSMLLVIGIMISYICSAVTDFLINFANESDIVNLTHWSHGSFSAASWSDVGISAAIILPTALVVFFLSKPISAYTLGEGYARSLGVNIKLFRILLIILSSILSAAVTAFAGPISFVGIAVPHICRLMLKTTKPVLMIPASFLCGAVFCMFCDLVARTVFSPVELSISTVTSAIGAPIVIWLMVTRRSKREE